MLSRTRARRVAVVLAAGACLFAVSAIWRASTALRRSEREVLEAQTVRFTDSVRQNAAPSDAALLAAPAVYTDAAVLDRRLYLAGPAGLFAYENDALVAQYRAGQELPPAPVSAVAVQHDILYAGTSGEGLLIFDGGKCRQIRPDEPRHRDITALLPLSTGRILIGTARAGLLVWDGSKLDTFHASLRSARVTALAGTDSDLWIGTMDNGVLHWNAGRLETHEQIPDPQVLALAVSGNRAFAGTALGIAEFRDGRLHRRLAEGVFAKALEVQGDILYAGTLDEGLYEVPLAGGRPRHVPVDASIERVFGKWLLARDGLYDRSGRRILGGADAELTDRNIAALSVDDEGRVWAGYFDRGLDILTPGGKRLRHIEDAHVFCINRVVHDRERKLHAIATANGLVLLDAGLNKRQVLTKADGLLSNHVTDVAITADGMTLATPAGLTLIDGAGPRSLYAFHGLVNNHVYAVAHNGSKLLAGTLGGASLLDAGMIQANFTTANSPLKHNWISAIVSAGDEWFAGTYGAGVFRLDSSRSWHGFYDLKGPIEINPNAMASSGRHVFAGTLGKGLLVYDRDSRRWRVVTAALPSLNVTAIAARNGYVYIGTDNGVIRRSEEAL